MGLRFHNGSAATGRTVLQHAHQAESVIALSHCNLRSPGVTHSAENTCHVSAVVVDFVHTEESMLLAANGRIRYAARGVKHMSRPLRIVTRCCCV